MKRRCFLSSERFEGKQLQLRRKSPRTSETWWRFECTAERDTFRLLPPGPATTTVRFEGRPAATSRVQFKSGRSTIRDYQKRRSFSRKTFSNISRRIMGRENNPFAAANTDVSWFSLAWNFVESHC